MKYRIIRKIQYYPLLTMLQLNRCKILKSDIDSFIENKKLKHRDLITILKLKEFRSILYYRYSRKNNILLISLTRIFSLFYKPQTSLYITCKNIGKGLFIQHGFSTIISAEKIGLNFHCGQLTTVGWAHGAAPVIGDNVYVGCNSTIIGGITIGDNTKIGAGCVIYKNIPSNCTVIGNPARIVKLNGKRVDIKL